MQYIKGRALSAMLLMISGLSTFPFSAAAMEAPKEFATCAACHGTSGEGNVASQAPVLAGLSKDYLLRQMAHFLSGIRGGELDSLSAQQMKQVSQSLLAEDKTRNAIAEYLAALPAPKLDYSQLGDIKKGNSYYQNNCGACHGGNAQGNEAMKAPRLANQHPDYLRRQFMAFREGVRGSHVEDKPGRQMAMMAKVLPQDVLDDVLSFIASQ
ncbi:c-type cytochrome [Aliiglaciecola sp. CAU 1673]|uniref:c-type cytochrome n=1 Tax=Aliiglaciecola sp. CAU 1673 TaxID=3032595 RepID=UPI0023DA4D9F|nr:c-type cytochrome [Aliiglaciecola sp. CAU 1673]MDF2179010.1 c-type cytochrome [Aliiglaciecola sp. CAU 1673]